MFKNTPSVFLLGVMAYALTSCSVMEMMSFTNKTHQPVTVQLIQKNQHPQESTPKETKFTLHGHNDKQSIMLGRGSVTPERLLRLSQDIQKMCFTVGQTTTCYDDPDEIHAFLSSRKNQSCHFIFGCQIDIKFK